MDDGLKNECVMYISQRVLRRIDCGETDIGVRGNNSVDLKKIGTPCFRKDGIFEGTKENKAKSSCLFYANAPSLCGLSSVIVGVCVTMRSTSIIFFT